MNSPKTPTNAGTGGNGDANAEPTPPTSVFKRMAGWLIGGSAKKRQRLATPTNTSNAVIANGHHQRQPTETTAPVSLGNDNDNGVAGTASSVLQPAISPLFSPLPPRKPMQKTSTSTSTAMLSTSTSTNDRSQNQGMGARIAPGPLPHHLACGSAPGD